ncbi:hypothetical protein [Frankia sp. QA3]|uniref:hypothetical protein n=1 Tax=Frankia sp. QA3 TaxID=710111 RepID=UPI000269CE04|nr:hypothetical protein [Frankia sp. QA3]EIV96180.1 hypothetical protein FraQA3DRAFT_6049 [Frankia sp. QA3]
MADGQREVLEGTPAPAQRHAAAETIAGGPLQEEGPGSLEPLRNGLIASLALIAVVMILMCSYASAFGKVSPHDISFAVAAPQAVADQLDASPALDVRQVDDLAAARRAVEHRDVYGALAFTNADSATLLVASGGSRSVQTALVQVGQRFAAASGTTLTVTDLAPTSSGNPSGTIEFYAIVFLAIGSALGATVLGRVLGTVRNLRHMGWRVGFLMFFTGLLSLAATVFVDGVYGALAGHPVPLFGVLWGYTTAICLACTGVASRFGTLASIVLTLTLTILGNPSAGGPVGRPLLNDFYAALTPYFPHGGGLSVLRGVQYFDGRGIASGVVCLVVWAGVGLLLLAGAAFRTGLRTGAAATAPTTGQPPTSG